MRATFFPYQSPEGSFCGGNNGGSSRSVVHQGQFPKTAVIIIAAYTARLVIFCYNDIIRPSRKQWNRRSLLDNISVQMINQLFAAVQMTLLLLSEMEHALVSFPIAQYQAASIFTIFMIIVSFKSISLLTELGRIHFVSSA